MRRFLAVAAVLALASPALAQSPTPGEPQPTVAKMRKVCKPGPSSNPLYPEMKCHMVPVASATVAPASSASEVAMQNSSAPH